MVHYQNNENAKKYFLRLAQQNNLNFVSLQSLPINTLSIEKSKCPEYLKLQAIPIAETNTTITIVTANPSEQNRKLIKEYWALEKQKKIIFQVTTRQDIVNILALKFEQEFIYDIAHTRDKMDYTHSASYTFSFGEKIFLTCLLTFMILAAFGNFFITTLWFHAFLAMGTTIIISYKTGLTLQTLRFLKKFKEKPSLDFDNLPIYTILIPLLQEKESTIGNLLESIDNFDYPKELLDVKLLLEKDDLTTLKIVNKFNLDWYFQVIIVPQGLPRSKPRACNYGLQLSFGDYLTIYDAEDRPDPDQLKRVLQLFKAKTTKALKFYGKYATPVACVQAALNFYNFKENLLTRLFTIEYTYWFDYLVPALASISAPVPLGGTSNHFRMDILRKIGGWDPYIGTEDAEIGVRLYRCGYRIEAINSTTYEEANTRLVNWFKQRTRWNKGYMQTFLVNMRDPLHMIEQVGVWRFINFLYFVGGNVFVQLANLPLIVFLVLGLILENKYFGYAYPKFLYFLTWYNFLASNVIYLFCNFIATYNRGLYSLLPFVPLKLFYWLIMSGAGYYAILELLIRPGYWYKTEHGLSKQTKDTDVAFTKKYK